MRLSLYRNKAYPFPVPLPKPGVSFTEEKQREGS